MISEISWATTPSKSICVPVAVQWLQKLHDLVPSLEYTEAKYWATFRAGQRAIAQLNPAQNSVRLFLCLDSSAELDLKPSPSTRAWAKNFPAVFDIRSESELPRAKELIVLSASARDPKATTGFHRRFDYLSPDEVDPSGEYSEGAVRQVTVNAYERNQEAREVCLRCYGRSCVICGFNFLEAYGTEVADIQVHHIKPIAQAGGEYALNPIKDLRPVCQIAMRSYTAKTHRLRSPKSSECYAMQIVGGTNSRSDRIIRRVYQILLHTQVPLLVSTDA